MIRFLQTITVTPMIPPNAFRHLIQRCALQESVQDDTTDLERRTENAGIRILRCCDEIHIASSRYQIIIYRVNIYLLSI
jgi:hypothetical protein